MYYTQEVFSFSKTTYTSEIEIPITPSFLGKAN